jgi:hypothetical protein
MRLVTPTTAKPSRPISLRKASLRNGLVEAGVIDAARRMFDLMPPMGRLATRYAWYIPCDVRIEERSVLADAMAEAVPALVKAYRQSERKAVQQFIRVLVEHAAILADYRLSVQNQQGERVIWDYAAPLGDLMLCLDQKAVSVRRRQKQFDQAALNVKLLSYVCTSADLQVAALSLTPAHEDTT